MMLHQINTGQVPLSGLALRSDEGCMYPFLCEAKTEFCFSINRENEGEFAERAINGSLEFKFVGLMKVA